MLLISKNFFDSEFDTLPRMSSHPQGDRDLALAHGQLPRQRRSLHRRPRQGQHQRSGRQRPSPGLGRDAEVMQVSVKKHKVLINSLLVEAYSFKVTNRFIMNSSKFISVVISRQAFHAAVPPPFLYFSRTLRSRRAQPWAAPFFASQRWTVTSGSAASSLTPSSTVGDETLSNVSPLVMYMTFLVSSQVDTSEDKSSYFKILSTFDSKVRVGV